MKMCAQRKAGRRQRASPAVCTFPMVPCGSSPVAPLPCKKRSAWGRGCCYSLLRTGLCIFFNPYKSSAKSKTFHNTEILTWLLWLFEILNLKKRNLFYQLISLSKKSETAFVVSIKNTSYFCLKTWKVTKVTYCQQQPYSGLRSPRRSCSTYLWNDSWVQNFRKERGVKCITERKTLCVFRFL